MSSYELHVCALRSREHVKDQCSGLCTPVTHTDIHQTCVANTISVSHQCTDGAVGARSADLTPTHYLPSARRPRLVVPSRHLVCHVVRQVVCCGLCIGVGP